MRFIGHLELAHLFYRASKRAGLSLCHSEGFHPMPRIVFARALPVGVESLNEIVHIELEKRILPQEVKERLHAVLPQGIEILNAKRSLSPFLLLSSLQHVYWVSLDHLLSKEEVLHGEKEPGKEELYIDQERKGKKRRMDIRPLIERMELKEETEDRRKGWAGWGGVVLRSERKTAKPRGRRGHPGLQGEALSQCRIVKVE